MKQYTAYLLALLMCIVSFINSPLERVSASTICEYPANYLTFEVPDGTLVMTPDTSEYDDVWAKARVTNPSAKLKEFKSMGVLASYYDPQTDITVNYIVKRSADTATGFSFQGMTDEAIKDYVAGQMNGIDNLEVNVDIINHPQAKFFRLEVLVTAVNAPAIEIIYGTLINGQMIQFDIYEDGNEPVDESFVQSIINTLHFTKLLNEKEYAEMATKNFKQLMAVILGIILIFIALIVVSKLIKRHEKNKAKRISEEMQNFRQRKNSGQVDISSPPAYTATCEYSKEAVNDFGVFNTWIKHIIPLACWAIILLIAASTLYRNGSTFYALIALALGIVILYVTYNRGEKVKEAFTKQYDISRNPVASYKFYNEYFTVTGLSSPVEYIYKQITGFRSYRGFLYIYIGSEAALIIDMASCDKYAELKAYIKERI